MFMRRLVKRQESLRGWDASCCVIIIGKEVKPSIANVCVCIGILVLYDIT
jgi:hypothetical protein